VDMGLDPNDPKFGRGLCKRCHDEHTARTSPGGWNRRD
jgi:5-methylcytosine-specific restriction protein A